MSFEKNLNTFCLFCIYRSELMGIAIIGVLIAHYFGLGEICQNNYFVKIIGTIPRLAFTQGFLFLSGFGLYYSFAKNGNIKYFYLRRLNRLLIPFFILSAWFFIYRDFIETFNPIGFFLHLSSLEFWVGGNYYGMWYIAISIVLYLLFPLFYKYIFTNGGATAAFVLLAVLISLAIQQLFPEYYEKVSIGINKFPVFILGIYAGQLSLYKKTKESIILLCLVCLFWIMSFFLKKHWEYVVEVYGMTEKIVYMSIICVLFSVSEKWIFVQWICKVLRWFGRYSLELYVLHLLIFCFISSEMLFGAILPIVKASIMIVGALLLCVPFHKLADVIVQKINFK